MIRIILIMIMVFQLAGAAKLTRLSGDIKGEMRSGDGPFLVTGDIRVPPGETVVVREGSVFLFQNFTGLIVEGTLLALGTDVLPIVFTSQNDSTYNSSSLIAAPYDWNGITIGADAPGSIFKDCLVRYSLFGINSMSNIISVRNCSFHQNGKADLKVAGKKIIPQNGTLSYHPWAPCESTAMVQQNTANCNRVVLRTVGVSFLIAGLAAGIWENLQFQKADEQLRRLRGNDSYAFQNWKDARDYRNLNLAGAIIGYSAAFTGAAGICISFKY